MYKTRLQTKIDFENDLHNKPILKDSFERFGDDLTELILNFLTINDKLNYETVSKQWKCLIFNKQKKLEFQYSFTRFRRNDDLLQKVFNYNNKRHELRLNPIAFKGLLKKFKFVKELYFSSEIKINDIILNLITSHCKYLEKLTISRRGFDFCSNNSIKRFGKRLGQRLKMIDLSLIVLHDQEKSKIIYDFSPNIEAFYFDNISIITAKPENHYSKLQKVVFGINSIPVNDFTKFTDFYYKQIKKISLGFDHLISYDSTEEVFDKKIFKELSRFENLCVLNLVLNDNKLAINDMENGLVMIGNKCKHLDKLFFTAYITEDVNQILINKRFFKIINSFQTLTKCEFNIDYEGNDFQFYTNHFNNENLKPMKNINHLVLDIQHLNDNHFEYLDKFMPNLKSIEINADNCSITDETLRTFARIESLTDVKLCKSNFDSEQEDDDSDPIHEITDEGVIDILRKCMNIKKIDISDRTAHITDKTIDAVMGLKLRPKVSYYFYFDDNIGGELHKYVESVEKYLSENIKIESFGDEF